MPNYNRTRHIALYGLSLMKLKYVLPLFALVGGMLCCTLAIGQEDKEKDRSRISVSKMEQRAGLFSFWWDDEKGKIWLQVKPKSDSFIYVTSLATGLGSNPVGLDRGQMGETRLVRFKRVGPTLFLEQLNTSYRASSSSPTEKRAVADSFAASIIWSGKIETGDDDSKVVDITSLLMRDAHDCVGKLSRTGQGDFRFESERSHLVPDRSKAFPENSEFEAAITLTAKKPGPLVRQTAATGNSITLRQHHSFVKLPDPGYRPRKYDPNCGCFSISFQDYSSSLDQPLTTRLITRHRLQKKDPTSSASEPVKPIIYYLDSGVPEPVKSALLDGANWWNDAFEEAGFQNAFQVKVLPADADPMDIRYNVIQWVHRSTRGWSYGQSVVDPRTGEIIKGHVLLGSLRVRQDYLLMRGAGVQSGDEQNQQCRVGDAPLVGPWSQLVERQLAESKANDLKSDVALARIRQLSAHEVGHTLGFAHNFAASTYDDRASVMDYPAPRIKIKNGKLDLSDAYGVGVGSWDRFTVRYAYAEMDPEKEARMLESWIAETIEKGKLYISDSDARPSGAAHPLANLWDNGENPVDGLKQAMDVRKIALSAFSSDILRDDEPASDLEKIFVPIYLHHRYQVEAAAKMLGGAYYRYGLKRNSTSVKPVPVEEQRRAFEELLRVLDADSLAIPPELLAQFVPKANGSPADRERFGSRTSPVFDSLEPVRVAVDLVLSQMLQPVRVSRIAVLGDNNWNLQVMLDRLIQFAFIPATEKPAANERIGRIIKLTLVNRLIRLATSSSSSEDAVAHSLMALRKIKTLISVQRKLQNVTPINAAHLQRLENHISQFLSGTDGGLGPGPAVESPPGSPIGN